jgi:hypothetical protein
MYDVGAASPKNAGIGERVAGDALQHGAGDPERGADQHREDGARDPLLHRG